MTIKPLAAGSGYRYLTDQVARHDATRTTDGPGWRGPAQNLGDYYTGSGNPPGRWLGRGAAALGVSGEVTEQQMEQLFAFGKDPNYAEKYKPLWDAKLDAAGGTEVFTPALSKKLQAEVDRELTLGRPFRKYMTLAERIEARISLVSDEGIEVTDEIRTTIEAEEKAKPGRQPIAGYDLTFSPVKSVSVVWSLGDAETRMAVEAAHHAAVGAAIEWLEDEVAGARDGTNGIAFRQVEGLIVTAFDHRTSRAGQPDLHTHAVVSNKVRAVALGNQPEKWLALDGASLFRAVVASSELYNTRLEDELRARLGVDFEIREGTGLEGRRPIREIAGVSVKLIEAFSARRDQIERAYDVLIADYHRDHGSYPDKATQYKLAQQANLASRPPKLRGSSEVSERAEWWQVARDVLGSNPRAMLTRALGRAVSTAEVTDQQMQDLAHQVVEVVGDHRSTWTVRHLQAEVQRATRDLHTPDTQARRELVDAVVARAVAASLLITPPDLVPVPWELTRPAVSVDSRTVPRPRPAPTIPPVPAPSPAPAPAPVPAAAPSPTPSAATPEAPTTPPATLAPAFNAGAYSRLFEANAAAAAYYQARLAAHQPAMAYLASRAITGAADATAPWGLGYAPQSWTGLRGHLRSVGFTDNELLLAGLITMSSRGTPIDVFRDRVVFPIRTEHGIVGFTGRDLSDRPDVPKYRNTAATAIYDKSGLIYGLTEQIPAGPPRMVVLVEGTADVLAIAQLPPAADGPGAGTMRAVAPLGTALTARQVELLAAAVPAGTPILIAFDGDAAGAKATRRAYDLLVTTPRWSGPVLSARLPTGVDPASMLADFGPAETARILREQTVPLAAALIEQIVSALPLDDILERDDIGRKVGALRQVLPYLRDLAAADPLDGSRAAIDFATRLDLDPVTVFEAIYPPADQHPAADPGDPAPEPATDTDPGPDVVPDRAGEYVSVFRHPAAELYTSRQVLAAERRLLNAATAKGPAVGHDPIQQAIAAAERPLADDQAAAVRDIAHSATALSLLIGPAGSGKTTTLRTLVRGWQATGAPVLGLALSANAADVLAEGTGLPAENIAKWLYETTGDGAAKRVARLAELAGLHNNSTHPAYREALSLAHAETTAEHERWRLRPGQLVIVDEAGLVGTLTLDRLRHQVAAVDGKLVLVGDWRQLQAIESGGALRLLDHAGHATALKTIWRFTQDWEGPASIRIRTGDITVASVYAEQGRIIEGTDHELREKMYANWSRDEKLGLTSLMMTVSTADAVDLALRARADRIAAGLVQPDGLTLREGTTAGIGDRIVVRKNNRRLKFGVRDWVRNGAIFSIEEILANGDVRVRHLKSGSGVTLPADFAAKYVELGYATTVTRALGMTVDTGHSLVHDTMTREQLYAAATRGAQSNLLYTPTFIPLDVDLERPAPEHRKGFEVLASAIAREAAEMSATETIRAEQSRIASLHTLVGQLDYARTAFSSGQFDRLLREHLPPGLADQVLSSDAYGPLGHALAEAQRAGYRLDTLVPAVIAQRELYSADDPAAALYARVLRTASRTVPAADGLPTWLPVRGFGDPRTPGLPRFSYTMVEAIRERVTELNLVTVADPPAWTRRLGPPPADPAERLRWQSLAGQIAVYRDLYQVTTADPLGPRPERPRQAQAWTYLSSQMNPGSTPPRPVPDANKPQPQLVPATPQPAGDPTPAPKPTSTPQPAPSADWDPEFAAEQEDPGVDLD